MTGLPAPVTTTEEYLAAVHEELVGLRADLAVSRGGETPSADQPQSGTTELIEPKAGRPRKRPS